MQLYIQIKNNQPFEHPILEDNFKAAFPHIDTDNLPSDFSRFERVDYPEIGVYEVYEGVVYQQVGDVYKDVHQVRDMTSDEIAAKKQSTKDKWKDTFNWSSWTFNEDTCSYDAPVSMPDDGDIYRWDEDTTSWVAL
tara:strand:- start:48 stop:455 length:408 start_codon:yes stop_codon:yes gene_type:complete